MVTLITEKLQNQSLDDLARKTYEASPYSAEKLNTSGSLFPFELNAGQSLQKQLARPPGAAGRLLSGLGSGPPCGPHGQVLAPVDKSPWKVLSGGQPVCSTVVQGPAFPFPPGPFSSAYTTGLQWLSDSPSLSAGLGSVTDVSLSEHSGQPLAPPTKRHCRSLSEPDELARCRSPWRPGGSKVWTPVSKRRCNSGGSATLQRGSGPGSSGLPRAAAPPLSHARPGASSSRPGASSSPPVAPRPASARGSLVDSGAAGPPGLSSRRRLSLSQEHIADAASALPSASSTPTATPEPSRRQGLLRSRSQPCVLDGRKSRRKRRREEEARGARPALDFLKMTRTLKNSKSLCSLDYEDDDDGDDDDDDAQGKTVVSSPCDSHDLMNLVTPGSSPVGECPRPCPAGPGPWTPREREAGEGASTRAPSESASAEGGGLFPLDCGDLDLEQIENN